MLVSKVTSRCLLMVIWAQPHSLMWLGPIGVHVHMYVKLLLGSSVPSIGFLKKTYMVMNSNLMTTIVSIASVRWLAVVVFSLGRNSLYAYTLRERLTFRWTLLDWKFSWNKQTVYLLASMSAVGFGLAIVALPGCFELHCHTDILHQRHSIEEVSSWQFCIPQSGCWRVDSIDQLAILTAILSSQWRSTFRHWWA
jgi:hypothetical protein